MANGASTDLYEILKMPQDKKRSFIINDENKTNSYGFRVKNEGIDLSRFKSNPIMLDYHIPGNNSVIGRWENIRIEGTQLLADPVFDEEDEDAAKIAGKVERGFIKGASMGLNLQNAKWELEDDIPTLMMCELTEVSIASLPSNANALKLYDSTGVELSQEAIQLSINENTFFPKKPIMKQLKLTAAALLALNLQAEDLENPKVVGDAVEKLTKDFKGNEAKLTAMTKERDELKQEVDGIKESQATALVELAVKQGKITADKKEYFLSLAKQDLETAKGIFDGIPAAKSLAGQAGAIPELSEFDAVKTVDDFEKLSDSQKLSFKEEHPDKYKQIFNLK